MSLDAADALARRCAEAMWAEDAASRGLGLRLVAVGPGRAELALTVTAAMVNGHGICHGGFIFALADSAFAFACNSRNQRSVAQHCAVTFLKPGRLADVLTASAVEVAVSGRSGVYDVRVTDAAGDLIAVFRGHSRTLPGALVAAPGPDERG